ncbi:Holliday junction resolvase RuvX [Desulfovibrio sp. OttesenSCG-928-I05]|nr:Holliday junction resolvase RuvX [Desulfovibrio sp. OttesenSCG-928-I05]
MKLLGIDYGTKRTGIAVTDSGGQMAFPRAVVVMETKQRFWEELLATFEAESPEALVVGLPLRSDGSDSLTTRQVRNFVESLKRRTALPVYLMQESYSSLEAEAMLREAGKKGKKAKAGLDAAAAARILESFLNLDEAKRIRA